jgi:hypothetical protein
MDTGIRYRRTRLNLVEDEEIMTLARRMLQIGQRRRPGEMNPSTDDLVLFRSRITRSGSVFFLGSTIP